MTAQNSSSFHPGPDGPTPEQRLLMLDDSSWEDFIEDCARQLLTDGDYVHVQRLGGAGDKGRDIAGYTSRTSEAGTWDLYQGKYYGKPLAPSDFIPELAKFLTNVFHGRITAPRNYFICAPRDVGTALFDLIRTPENLKARLLEDWQKKGGDIFSGGEELTNSLRAFVEAFPFDIIANKTPKDLLAIHARNEAKHWQKFGVLGRRGENPPIPDMPTINEHGYVDELLKVYSEHFGVEISDPKDIPQNIVKHFKSQRRIFYSAEGLNRFSRDKLPGAFDDLINQIEEGIGPTIFAPHSDGMTRLKETLAAANALQVNTNPLRNRLRAGDLQGGCHHLANQSRVSWVDNENEDDNSI